MICPWFPHLWQSRLSKMFCCRKTVLFKLYFHRDFLCLLNEPLGLCTRVFLCLSTFNFFKGDTQTKTLKRVLLRNIFSRRFLLFTSSFEKKIESNYVTFSYWHFLFFFFCFFFSIYWHHSWHNNRLRRLTGLWGKYRLRPVSLFLQI